MSQPQEQVESDDSGIDVKTRKKREVKITPEMEPYLDTFGTHCLKCGIKLKT